MIQEQGKDIAYSYFPDSELTIMLQLQFITNTYFEMVNIQFEIQIKS